MFRSLENQPFIRNRVVAAARASHSCPSRRARHTQRVMTQQLGRVPAITRRLDFVREWKEWKSAYGVTGIPGITGKGSPHWYRCSALRGAGPRREHPGQS